MIRLGLVQQENQGVHSANYLTTSLGKCSPSITLSADAECGRELHVPFEGPHPSGQTSLRNKTVTVKR
jgi:hypothetical protein